MWRVRKALWLVWRPVAWVGWQAVRLRLPVARVGGVTLSLHWSLLPFMVAAVAWGDWPYGALGFAGYEVGGLFGLVLLHEVGHVVAARALGRSVTEVVLSPVAGAAVIDGTGRWWEDGIIAAAGPATNAALVPVLWAAGRWGWPPRAGDAGLLVESLARLNLVLLGSNLLPLFPLDGGRIAVAAATGRWGPTRGPLVAVGAAVVVALMAVPLLPAHVGPALVGPALVPFLALFVVPANVLLVVRALQMRRYEQAAGHVVGLRCPRCAGPALDGPVAECGRCGGHGNPWRAGGRCPGCCQPLDRVRCPFCTAASSPADWGVPAEAEGGWVPVAAHELPVPAVPVRRGRWAAKMRAIGSGR